MKESCRHNWKVARERGNKVRYQCGKCLLWDNQWTKAPPVDVLERVAEALRKLAPAIKENVAEVAAMTSRMADLNKYTSRSALEAMTVPLLRHYAKAHKVDGIGTKMRKAELIDTIMRARVS